MCNRPQSRLRNGGPADALWQLEYVLLNLRDDAQEHEDLGDSGPGGGRAGVEFLAPSDGLAEHFDHGRREGLPAWLRARSSAGPLGDGGRDLVGEHPACQGAEIAVLGGLPGLDGDFECPFAVGVTR